MRCPICKETCLARTTEGGVHEECRAGHGLLVQGEQLARVMAALADEHAVGTAELHEVLVKNIARAENEKRRCPNCWADMVTYNYAYNSNIFLERCPSCGMVWIDADERVRLMRYLRGNPKIDRLAAAMAEHEHERYQEACAMNGKRESVFETCVKEALRPGQPLLTRCIFAGLAVLIALVVVYAVWVRAQR